MNLSAVDIGNTLPALPSLPAAQFSVLSGNYSQLLAGQLYSARFAPTTATNASLNLGGTQLAVRVPPGVTLNPNVPVLVRLQPGTSTPTLEVFGQWTPAPAQGSTSAAVQSPTSNSTNAQSSIPLTLSGPLVRALVQQGINGQLQINLGGQSIPIQSSELAPGQTILVRLATSTGGAAQSSTNPSSINVGSANGNSSNSLSVPVRAEVLKALPDGQYLVQVGGKAITVQSDATLEPGSKVVARLVPSSQGTTLEFDSVSESDTAVAVLRDLPAQAALGTTFQNLSQSISAFVATAGKNAPAVELVQQLQATIAKLVGPTETAPSPQQLAQFVRDGGLQYEAKIAQAVNDPSTPVSSAVENDVKGQLLNILSAARNAPASNDSSPTAQGAGTSSDTETIPVLAPVRTALEHIESQQALNVVAKAQGEPFQLQFPLAIGGSLTTMQLAIQPDRGGGNAGTDGESTGYNLLMHLDLTETGTTWVDANIKGQSIRTVLYIQNEAGRAQARESLPELQDSLQQLGFTKVSLQVRSALDRPDGPDASRFHALESAMPESLSLVDRRA